MSNQTSYFGRFSVWRRAARGHGDETVAVETHARDQPGQDLVSVALPRPSSSQRIDARVAAPPMPSLPPQPIPKDRPPSTMFLTTKETAELCRLSVRTLERYRVNGDGPMYTKAGPGKRARVVYRQSDVLAWLDQNRYSSTSDRDLQKYKAGR